MTLPLNTTATWEAILAEHARMVELEDEHPWHLHAGGWTPFDELPLARRVAAVEELRREIAAECPQFESLGILYTNRDERDDRPQETWTHREAQAIGNKEGVIWNFQLSTASFHARGLASEMARLLFKHHIANDQERRQLDKETKAFLKSLSSRKLNAYTNRPDKGFPRFGGLSHHELTDLIEGEVLRRLPPPVHETVEIKKGYEYGTGVTCCLDVPYLTDAIVLATIQRFRDNGEQGWCSENPIAPERLTKETDFEQFSRLARNGWPEKYDAPRPVMPPEIAEFLDSFFDAQ